MSHTFSAFSMPFANKSSITAEKILAPLKYKLFVWYVDQLYKSYQNEN